MLKLDDIIYYGRFYACEKREYSVLWWLSADELRVFATKELISDFGYGSVDEIAASERFIPFFETDVIELEKRFMYGRNEHELEKIRETAKDYDVAFRIYTEKHFLTSAWHDYEREALLHDAEKWCRENGIPYSI